MSTASPYLWATGFASIQKATSADTFTFPKIDTVIEQKAGESIWGDDADSASFTITMKHNGYVKTTTLSISAA